MRKTLWILSLLSTTVAACGAGVPSMTPLPTARPTALPAILSGPDTPGVYRPSACPFALPDGLVEGVDVECGYLPVYEDRQEGEPVIGRTIRLAVAVFHPPGGETQSDPVIYLSGGPGASILKLIRYQYEILSEPVFATGRTLILFDQRGIGLSQPALSCQEFSELHQEMLDREMGGQAVTEEQAVALALDSLRSCRDRLAQIADLSAYNSASSAADVHDLCQALGYESVNLWGGSYGTRLALEVMRRYPEALRSVVLDAVYPPDVDLYRSAPDNYHRSLTKLFESCASNAVCADEYPDLEKVLFDTVDRLNEEPVDREINNDFTGESLEVRVNGDVLLTLVFQMLYDSKLRYFIPRIIYEVSQGDFDYVDSVYSSMTTMASISSRGMMFSVQCHEELSFSSQAAFEVELDQYPELAGMYENSILGGLAYRACEIWSVGQSDPSANQPVESDVPVLILSGEFDPITPPEWGFHAAESLENAFPFEFPGIGHGASVADPCPKGMMIHFLDDPYQAPDSSCIAEMH
jgi:pimeloyl-ACP methyl ester carboxylesterase